MILTLTATGPHARTLGSESQKTFTEAGGTIGRGAGVDGTHWSLPHDFVSALHAEISYANGTFYVEDAGSTNGIYVNGATARLQPQRQHAFTQGDRIEIRPFTIRVSITDDERIHDAGEERTPATSGDFIAALVGPPPEPARTPPGHRSGPRVDRPASQEHMATPQVRVDEQDLADSAAIPPGYNPADSVCVARAASVMRTPVSEAGSAVSGVNAVKDTPRIPPIRPAAATERAHGCGTLADVFAGAGLKNAPTSPELARDVGVIFRTVVQGVLDVLRARRDVKREFDLDQTRIGPEKNNPLKYSTDPDDALHNLFIKRSAAFLGPVDAFEDAFDDLRHHQMAMLAGVRAAFDSMLAQFNPAVLDEEFSRRATGALVPLPNKFRNWDLYKEKYEDLVRDADAAFDRLFGEEFGTAYAAQLDNLKARRRQGTS